MTARARPALDLALFAALLVAYNPSWTGLAVHEWLCVAAVVPLLFHLIVNWEWVVQVGRRFGARLRVTPRVNLVVDAGLFVAAVTVMLSGLMVSQSIAGALGLVIVPDSTWVRCTRGRPTSTSPCCSCTSPCTGGGSSRPRRRAVARPAAAPIRPRPRAGDPAPRSPSSPYRP